MVNMQALETIFYLKTSHKLNLLLKELPKLEVVRNYFSQILSAQQYVQRRAIHLRMVRLPFHTER